MLCAVALDTRYAFLELFDQMSQIKGCIDLSCASLDLSNAFEQNDFL